jgi:hypothetical protein
LYHSTKRQSWVYLLGFIAFLFSNSLNSALVFIYFSFLSGYIHCMGGFIVTVSNRLIEYIG